MADISAVKEITAKLESGVKDLFESDKYAAYLQTMSRFHQYSTRNTLLIHLQMPSATRVVGYNAWKNNFKRQVSEWICVPNTHEPIVSRELFERVQTLHEQASAIRLKPYAPHILAGKVFCARCGQPMHRHKQKKHDYYWYRCQSQWKYGQHTCVQVSVKESDLKTEILTLLHKQAEAILGRFISLEKSTNEKALDTELREINAKLDKGGRMRQSLYENMVSALITQDEYMQMKAYYEAKIAALSRCAGEIRDSNLYPAISYNPPLYLAFRVGILPIHVGWLHIMFDGFKRAVQLFVQL